MVYSVREPLISVSIFSSEVMLIVSLGIRRIMSRKIRAERTISPGARTFASIAVEIASSRS